MVGATATASGVYAVSEQTFERYLPGRGWRIGKPDQTFSIPEQAVPADGVVS